MTGPVPRTIVVGAGPAGAAAAIELGRAGVRTLLVDRARFPRDKCCGDGLTTGALRRLDALGLDPSSVASFTVCDELAVRSPTGRLARLPLGRGDGIGAATARRADLDAALVELARRTPHVEVVEGDGFSGLDFAGGELRVHLDSGRSVRATTVVAADGAWSPVRRALGGRGELGGADFYAYRAYAHRVDEEALRRLFVIFEASLLPGYAWAFPVGDSLNLGICFARRPGESGRGLLARWDAFLADEYLVALVGRDAVVENPPRAWPIPAAGDPAALSAADGRVLFVGDAAGLGDPFSGEGIAQALESGAAVAAAIASGRGADGIAADYRARIRARLGRDHALARRLRALMARPIGARGAVAASAATGFTRREVGRWLYEDYPRAIAFTPALWRRGVLSAPAPFAGRGD